MTNPEFFYQNSRIRVSIRLFPSDHHSLDRGKIFLNAQLHMSVCRTIFRITANFGQTLHLKKVPLKDLKNQYVFLKKQEKTWS
jgi:hypothetical protein